MSHLVFFLWGVHYWTIWDLYQANALQFPVINIWPLLLQFHRNYESTIVMGVKQAVMSHMQSTMHECSNTHSQLNSFAGEPLTYKMFSTWATWSITLQPSWRKCYAIVCVFFSTQSYLLQINNTTFSISFSLIHISDPLISCSWWYLFRELQ